jgi:outer membrane receptor protein involved in Fe transport
MKYKLKRSWLVLLLAAATPWAFLTAQDSTGEQEVFELSPFAVDASGDTGYRATSTIAGSRLNTQLRDVAASVTVLTNEFLDDLGATDLAHGLSMIAGVETEVTSDQTGIHQLGFIGTDFGDRNNFEGSIRVRGLGSATTAADFLKVRSGVDRYNVERAQFLRGPNSILFGLAKPAGLVNYTTKKAHLSRNLNELQLMLDNFGTVRGVADVSRVLKEDVLAVRAVLKHSEDRYMYEDSKNRDSRIYLTGSYKPFEGTKITAYVEEIDTFGNRPNYRIPADYASLWLDEWNQAHQNVPAGELDAFLDSNFYWDPVNTPTANGVAPASPDYSFDHPFTVDENGQPVPIRAMLRDRLPGHKLALAGFYDNNDWYTPIGGHYTRRGTRNENGGQPSAGSGNRKEFHMSGNPFASIRNFLDPQVTDESIFPFLDYDLSSMPGSYRSVDNKKQQISIEQKINEDFYVSASFLKEDDLRRQAFAPIAQQQGVAIDINKSLPDGRVNQNFLRPFIAGRSIAESEHIEADNYLFQATYDLDFAEKTDRFAWLGRHQISAFTSGSTEDSLYYKWSSAVLGNNDLFVDRIANSGTRQQYPIFYIGDAVQPGDTSLRITGMPDTVMPYVDTSHPYLYYDSSDQWLLSDSEVSTGEGRFQQRRTEIDATGLGGSLQSYLFGNRVVVTLGWREDEVDQINHQLVGLTEDPSDPNYNPGASRSDYVGIKDNGIVSLKEPTITKGIVYHITPSLRVFGNKSENFDLTTPRSDNLFRTIAPQSGTVEEYGIGLNAFQGKLDTKLTFYESSQRFQSVNFGLARNAMRGVEIDFRNALFNVKDPVTGKSRINEYSYITGFNQASGDPVIESSSEIPALDENGVQIVDVEGVPQFEAVGEYMTGSNTSATQDSISEGWELSTTYNPTSNLRLMFNFSQLENRISNTQQEVLDYINYRQPLWSSLFAEGLHTDGDDTNPDTDLKQEFLSGLGGKLLEQMQANGLSNTGISKYNARVTANYRFNEGRFKGFSVGTNLRWEDGKILGTQLKEIDTTIGGVNSPALIADLDNVFETDQIVTGGLMFNYKRKLRNDKVDWRVQLNADNVFRQGDDVRVIRILADGSPVVGANNPTTFRLTNTFKF